MELHVEASENIEKLEVWSFVNEESEKLVAIWIGGRAFDDLEGIAADLFLRDVAAVSAVGVDVLNGREQVLDFEVDCGSTLVKGYVIHNCPTVIRIP